MMQLTQFHHQFKRQRVEQEQRHESAMDVAPIRARPGQRHEAQLWYASAPDLARYIAYYAISTWVYTAVTRMAEAAASAPLRVVKRGEETAQDDDHPLARLLGEYGEPNPYQSPIEFWEEHFTSLELAGNSFWYLESVGGGQPTAIHQLSPECVRILPGERALVAGYEYLVRGNTMAINPANVIHFKKHNPFSRYWGLSAMEALTLTILGDRAAAEWNRDFFGDGVAVPAGILVVPSSVSDRERDRMDREWNAKHGERRQTAIVRADPGSVTWYNAGLVQKDVDFESGRKLTRQEVYEALGLPLGYLSEASTEAHARVAERQLMWQVHQRHQRTTSRITTKLLPYFPGWRSRVARFRDVRLDAADWDEQAKKLKAIAPFVSTNEVRTKHLGMEAVAGGDDLFKASLPSPQPGQPDDSGDYRPVQHQGQIRDLVGRE